MPPPSWSRRLLQLEAPSLCTAAGLPSDVTWVDAIVLRRTLGGGVLLACEGVRAAGLVALRGEVSAPALSTLHSATARAVVTVLDDGPE